MRLNFFSSLLIQKLRETLRSSFRELIAEGVENHGLSKGAENNHFVPRWREEKKNCRHFLHETLLGDLFQRQNDVLEEKI